MYVASGFHGFHGCKFPVGVCLCIHSCVCVCVCRFVGVLVERPEKKGQAINPVLVNLILQH